MARRRLDCNVSFDLAGAVKAWLLRVSVFLLVAINSRLSPLLRIITHVQPVALIGHTHLRAASVAESERKGQHREENTRQPSSIMPFSYPAFDKHLCEVHVIVDEGSLEQLRRNKLSEKLTQRHNTNKPLSNQPEYPIGCDREGKKIDEIQSTLHG